MVHVVLKIDFFFTIAQPAVTPDAVDLQSAVGAVIKAGRDMPLIEHACCHEAAVRKALVKISALCKALRS